MSQRRLGTISSYRALAVAAYFRFSFWSTIRLLDQWRPRHTVYRWESSLPKCHITGTKPDTLEFLDEFRYPKRVYYMPRSTFTMRKSVYRDVASREKYVCIFLDNDTQINHRIHNLSLIWFKNVDGKLMRRYIKNKYPTSYPSGMNVAVLRENSQEQADPCHPG